MIDELNKRIIELMVRTEHSKSSFAKAVDISLPIITHITTGRNKPGIDLIQKILTHFETINPEWLLLGKGEMYKAKPKTVDLDAIILEMGKLAKEFVKLKANHQTIIHYHQLLADEVKHLSELDQKLVSDDQLIDSFAQQMDKLVAEIKSKVDIDV